MEGLQLDLTVRARLPDMLLKKGTDTGVQSL